MLVTEHKNTASLYVHVPFCKTKCHYCAFYKEIWTAEKEEAFIKAVCVEIKAYKEKASKLIVPSIFLGGGTPSLLKPNSLKLLFDTIITTFQIEPNCEITMEVNPESVNKNFLTTLKEVGINRLSIGIQSFNNDELKFLGRSHTDVTIHQALETIRAHSHFNLNLDLIFSLPNSTHKTLEYSLNNALLYSPEHLSTYALSIEHGTVFDRKKVRPLESDTELDQYEQIKDTLAKKEFDHYEISAFAKANKQCIHNRRYWEYKPFIGVGPSGHSFFNNYRFENEANLERYLAEPTSRLQLCNQVKLSKKERIEEFVMSNLRLKEGFSFKRFELEFDESFSSKFKEQVERLDRLDLISITKSHIKTSKKGQSLLNTVLEEFIP
jgi:oxygen-independent coproporphyrinogen III oxidase